MSFPTTQWTLLAHAALGGDAADQAALAEFYRHYREPVLGFIRRRGLPPDDVEDLAQAFFLHLIGQGTLRRADASRGRFRSFLLGSLVRFLAHARDRREALKRGGDVDIVSLEVGATTTDEPTVPAVESQAYDRDWAVQLLRRALTALETEHQQQGRVDDFAVLRAFLPGSGRPVPTYEDGAARLGLGPGTFKTEVHRLRARLRDLLRREVAATVTSPEEIDDEVTYLGRVLRDAAR